MKKAVEGLLDFCGMFNSSVFHLEDSKTIHIKRYMIEQKAAEYGIDCLFVLCCRFYSGRYSYHYLGDDNQLVVTFSKARAFKDEAEAIEAKNQAIAKYPKRVFEIVGLR